METIEHPSLQRGKSFRAATKTSTGEITATLCWALWLTETRVGADMWYHGNPNEVPKPNPSPMTQARKSTDSRGQEDLRGFWFLNHTFAFDRLQQQAVRWFVIVWQPRGLLRFYLQEMGRTFPQSKKNNNKDSCVTFLILQRVWAHCTHHQHLGPADFLYISFRGLMRWPCGAKRWTVGYEKDRVLSGLLLQNNTR